MKRRVRFGRVAICLTAAGLTFAVGRDLRAQDGFDLDSSTMAGMGSGQMVRGTVTSAGGDHIWVKTEKGEIYQISVTSNTKIVKERQPFRLANLKPGDNVGAMGVLDAPAKTVHALVVMVVDAEQVKKAREGLGKLYIAGRITAIDELKLTVLRPDNVSQVIEVDEGTSFRKGGRQIASAISGFGPVDGAATNAENAGESITLADIKVGDTIAGKGGLKKGVFFPTQLAVVDKPARQQRRK